jgi:hypothetical protein
MGFHLLYSCLFSSVVASFFFVIIHTGAIIEEAFNKSCLWQFRRLLLGVWLRHGSDEGTFLLIRLCSSSKAALYPLNGFSISLRIR